MAVGVLGLREGGEGGHSLGCDKLWSGGAGWHYRVSGRGEMLIPILEECVQEDPP